MIPTIRIWGSGPLYHGGDGDDGAACNQEGQAGDDRRMEAVVKEIVIVLNKEGSATEVLRAMCSKFVGFTWDPIAHNFELRYLD